MSLATYSDLQTAVQTWMDRSDLSGNAPDFITLCEAHLQRTLRSREMVTTATLTTTGGSVALPADFLQAIDLIWTGNPFTSLVEYDDQVFEQKYGNLNAGTPQAYLIRASTLYVAPVDNTTALNLVYYQKIPALSGGNPTNWLLTAHPDVYLFGSLAEAEMFTLDGPSAQIWKSRRDEVLEEIWKSGQFYRGAAVSIRNIGPTP